jgi:hypothetical protein
VIGIRHGCVNRGTKIEMTGIWRTKGRRKTVKSRSNCNVNINKHVNKYRYILKSYVEKEVNA